MTTIDTITETIATRNLVAAEWTTVAEVLDLVDVKPRGPHGPMPWTSLADDAPVAIVTGYSADDGSAELHFATAESPEEAAELYVGGGDWAVDETGPTTVTVYVWRRAITVADDGSIVELMVDRQGISVETPE